LKDLAVNNARYYPKTAERLAERFPETSNALAQWYRQMKQGDFASIEEIREIFPAADKVGKLTVFNISGNKVRLIAAIHYNRKKVYVRAVLTHSEYNDGKWRE
jgi:mRNA interferase HigB